jgi:hypothetical protein
MRRGEFDAVLDGDCQIIVNPLLDGTRYLPRSVSPSNYGYYEDPSEVELYERMLRETDFARQRDLMRRFRKAGARHRGARNLPAMALSHRAISQPTQRLEGESEPLRQLNQDLATIWLDSEATARAAGKRCRTADAAGVPCGGIAGMPANDQARRRRAAAYNIFYLL